MSKETNITPNILRCISKPDGMKIMVGDFLKLNGDHYDLYRSDGYLTGGYLWTDHYEENKLHFEVADAMPARTKL